MVAILIGLAPAFIASSKGSVVRAMVVLWRSDLHSCLTSFLDNKSQYGRY